MSNALVAGQLQPAGVQPAYVPPVGELRLSLERVRCALLWLMGCSGALAFIEPSPYELVGTLTIIFFAVTGLTLRASLAPLVVLLILYLIGFLIAVVPVSDESKPVTWVAISTYLAGTAIFFAGMVGTDTQRRLDALLGGYIAAAVLASVIGVVAYFHGFGRLSETFLLYGRARGTFNDPNVLGAFLVLPATLLLQRILAGRLSTLIGCGSLLMLMLAALFLSFSRAAWGQFVFAAALLMGLTYVTSRSASERFRIVLLGIGGAVVLALFFVALLSIDQVASLFQQRASLEQSYDLGHYGRFGRYITGLQLALDHPFGIGPLQFAKIEPEDPHNTYLNTFMSGGWLTGISYFTLVALTVVMGLRYTIRPSPWRATYQALYAAFLGVAGESAIIDSDHWRHYFLILGLLWGLMASARAAEPGALAPLATERYSKPGGA